MTNNVACFVPTELKRLVEEMKQCLALIKKTEAAYRDEPNEDTLLPMVQALEWFKDVDRRTRLSLNLPSLEE